MIAGLVFIPHVLALAIALHVMIASCVRIVKSMLAIQLLQTLSPPSNSSIVTGVK